MKIRRWKRVEALVAVDGHGWVRGIVLPDCDGDLLYADALDTPDYRLMSSERAAKQYVRQRLQEKAGGSND